MSYANRERLLAQPPTFETPETLPGTEDYLDRFSAYTPWAAPAGESATTLATSLGKAADSPLYAELERQALDDLKLGGQLGEDELRAASQSGVAGWSSRGLGRAPGAVFSSVLNRIAAQNARKTERRNFAAGVESLRQKGIETGSSALGALTGSGTLGLAFGQGVREYEQGREDALTTAQNANDWELYSADAGIAAANKSSRGSLFGSALGAVASIASAFI